MRSRIFGAFIVASLWSTQAIAANRTWICAALFSRTDKEPTQFKFERNGDEIVDANLWQKEFAKRWLGDEGTEVTRYKIMQENENLLVAISTDERSKEPSARLLLIDKAAGKFRQTIILQKRSDETLNFEGTCQASK